MRLRCIQHCVGLFAVIVRTEENMCYMHTFVWVRMHTYTSWYKYKCKSSRSYTIHTLTHTLAGLYHICICSFAIRISANIHFDWMVESSSKFSMYSEGKSISTYTCTHTGICSYVWQLLMPHRYIDTYILSHTITESMYTITIIFFFPTWSVLEIVGSGDFFLVYCFYSKRNKIIHNCVFALPFSSLY